MTRRPDAFLVSLAVAALLLSGMARLSVGDGPCGALRGTIPFISEVLSAAFSSWSQPVRTLTAASDEDSDDSGKDKDKKNSPDDKGDDDGRLKELWDSVQLG